MITVLVLHRYCLLQGFLLIDSFFTEDELNPGKDAINDLVDELAHKLYNAGKIKSMHICN